MTRRIEMSKPKTRTEKGPTKRTEPHIPLRTCIVCRACRAKHELFRMVLDSEGRLIRDESARLPGRGAYVCASKSCQEAIISNRKDVLNRAFRTKGVIVTSSFLCDKPGRREA